MNLETQRGNKGTWTGVVLWRAGAEAAAVWVQAAGCLGALCLHRTEVGGCVLQLGGCDV